jgi:hypothetical protein
MAGLDDFYRPLEADGLQRKGRRPLSVPQFDANGPTFGGGSSAPRLFNFDADRKGGADAADGPGSVDHYAGNMYSVAAIRQLFSPEQFF